MLFDFIGIDFQHWFAPMHNIPHCVLFPSVAPNSLMTCLHAAVSTQSDLSLSCSAAYNTIDRGVDLTDGSLTTILIRFRDKGFLKELRRKRPLHSSVQPEELFSRLIL